MSKHRSGGSSTRVVARGRHRLRDRLREDEPPTPSADEAHEVVGEVEDVLEPTATPVRRPSIPSPRPDPFPPIPPERPEAHGRHAAAPPAHRQG